MVIRRRVLLGGMLAAPAIIGRARAEDTTIKIGALKLIHSMTPYFYQQFAPPGTKIEIIVLRKPDRRQERRGHQIRRCRHLRHRRRHLQRRGARAARGHRFRMQQRHGDRRRQEQRHRQADRPEGQARRHLARLHAGGLRPRAPAHGGDVGEGHHARPRILQRNARRPPTRRRGCLCRRRARPRAFGHQRATARSWSIPTPRRWAA